MLRPGIDSCCGSGNPVEVPLRGFENRFAKDQAQQLRPPKAPSLGAGAFIIDRSVAIGSLVNAIWHLDRSSLPGDSH
jgi:hypothetical protein